MKRNKIKIICNSDMNIISYYFQNERDEWIRVSNSSILSRKEYVQTSLRDKSKEIVQVIVELYNPGNRGVDIYLEGDDDDFSVLQSTIKEYFSVDNIECVLKQTKIAVVGKIGSGKTTVIESIGKYIGCEFEVRAENGFISYKDQNGNSVWHELKGIDIYSQSIVDTENTVDKMIQDGLTVFVYCFGTNKIEEIEEKMILKIKKANPEITVLALLTSCVEDDAILFAEQVSKKLDKVKVIPVLAKDISTRYGIISSYGIEDLTKFIFGGKRIG